MARDRGRRLEAESVERVGPQVGEEDVGRREQFLEALALASRWRRSRTTLRLPRLSCAKAGFGKSLPMPSEPKALRIGSPARRLHLDDVGAPVGQQGAGGRRGDPDAHLDDAQAGQRRQAGRFAPLGGSGLVGHGVRLPVRPAAAS